MEEMTNKLVENLIKMIIQVIKDSETKEEAVKKIEALLDK